MLRLVIEDGEGTTHVVPLIRDEITIGRQEGNTIRLTERNVSRRHARLVRAGTQSSPTVLVEDLDSYNGIRLNGDRIAGKCTMRPADLLQIGDYSLALKTEDVTDADLGSLAAAAAHDEPPPPPVDPRLPEEERGRFVVVSSNLAGNEYALDRREVIIGRTDADENDVVIAHRSISRHHAKIIHRDGTFTIIDLASSNGVKVNGEAFGTATLVNGDIIELGHVKLRFCAPADDYIFTSADVDDVEVESGPSSWQLIFVALLLVGVAIVAFLIVDRVAHNRQAEAGANAGQKGAAQKPPPEAPPPVEAAPDVQPIVARGTAALEAEKWDEARKIFDEALAKVPDHDEARAGRDRALREAANQPLFEGLERAVDDTRWSDAFARLQEFPNDSVYAPRVKARRSEIEDGYADAELERGRLFIQADEINNAERVHKRLTKKDFAADQAATLAEEISKARQQPSTPPTAVAPVAHNGGEAPKPAARPTPRPKPTASGDLSFEELNTRAVRHTIRGDRDAAIVLLKQAAKKRPGSHLPHQRLCSIYKAKQHYKQALASCKK